MTKDQEEISFSQVLSELLDAEHVFNPKRIHYLSRLGPEDSTALAAEWENIPLTRRRNLLSDLVTFAEADPLLFFDPVGRIALKDADPDVRIAALRLLAIEEEPAFAETLLHFLTSDAHYNVRAAAALTLGKYVYLGEIEEIPADLFKTIEEALLAAYRDDEQVLVRRRALEAVAFSSRKEINSLIEDAYISGDEDWQETALIAMGVSANPKWEPKVTEMLDSESSVLRLEAVVAAGRLNLKETKHLLISIAQEDDDSDVREAAVWALSEIGGSDVAELIEGWIDEAETDEEADFLEDALENLLENQMFDDMDLPLFDFDEDSLNDLSELDMDDEGDE